MTEEGTGEAPIRTPATRAAAAAGISFRTVRTERPSSAEQSAALQGIVPSQLLRTIVVRGAHDDYVFVLVPGGRQIAWPKLRRHLGVSRLSLPDRKEAWAATGYERGAITPFGSKREWPVIADLTVAGEVAIGGGAHGVNMHMAAEDLLRATAATVADVTVAADGAGDRR